MHSQIFKEVTLANKVKINNRIVMAPMTTWGSNNDNTISNEEIEFYTRRANNLGILITGCTHVSYNGIGFENEFSAYDDRFIPGLKKLAEEIKKHNTKAIVQINHAGNKALQHLIKGADVVSASDIATLDTEFAASCETRPLTEAEIWAIIKDFGQTTRRLIQAGFDGVEIHGAHGFLIQNFMSPFFNKRSDDWGGTVNNRMRFALEIVKEIRNIIKKSGKENFILGYRLSPDEPMENALRLEDNYNLIEELIKLNIDYLHISLANALKDKPIGSEKTYLELISKFLQHRLPLMVAGNIKTKDDIEKVLAQGADFVAIGRSLVTDPDFLEKIKNEQEIKQKLNLTAVDNLKLPQKLLTEIMKNIGWFDIK